MIKVIGQGIICKADAEGIENGLPEFYVQMQIGPNRTENDSVVSLTNIKDSKDLKGFKNFEDLVEKSCEMWIVLDESYDFQFSCYSEGVFKDELQTLEELESKAVSKFMDSAKTRFGEFKHQLGLHDIGRSLFPIQEMPEGALPIYDKDCDKRIIINGSEYIIWSQSISFEKIVELDETNKGFTNPNDLSQIRMSCKSSMDDKFETFLTQGDSVPVIDGMVFWTTAATPVPIIKEDFPNTFLDDFGNIRIGED